MSPSDLDSLMSTLDVSFVKLTECLVSPGWRLVLAGTNAAGIHYNLRGTGRLIVADHPPIDLIPHTLIIVPPEQTFRIEAPIDEHPTEELRTVESHSQHFAPGVLRKFVAGEGEPQIILICGYFRAFFGSSIDLFGSLTGPIVERFGAHDHLDHTLAAALEELVVQEVGSGAMTTALLKQVLITLLRRSLSSKDLLVERFSMLSDPQIARVFSDMVARPGFAHTVQSLAQTAGLSRSAFMARFKALFGRAPMEALRDLRMRQAAALLATHALSVDQIARSAGYASRSSFLRAFRQTYGSDPSEYRATSRPAAADRKMIVG
jgi:AraC family transcriptional activator of mtrCDE